MSTGAATSRNVSCPPATSSSSTSRTTPRRLYAAAIDSGFEGIVAKRKDSTYQPGRRSSAWLKIKAVKTAEFVVGGYTQGKGARERLGALLLGYWDGKELRYVGHVGSGLTEATVKELRERLAELATKQSPFAEKAGPPSTHDLAQARARCRSQFCRLDTGRTLARAGVHAIARGSCAAKHPQRPARERQQRPQGRRHTIERDRVGTRTARWHGQPVSISPSAARASG